MWGQGKVGRWRDGDEGKWNEAKWKEARRRGRNQQGEKRQVGKRHGKELSGEWKEAKRGEVAAALDRRRRCVRPNELLCLTERAAAFDRHCCCI